jgi:hypothetical protein
MYNFLIYFKAENLNYCFIFLLPLVPAVCKNSPIIPRINLFVLSSLKYCLERVEKTVNIL